MIASAVLLLACHPGVPPKGGGPSAAPTTVPTAAVSAGSAHTCLLNTDGTLACWGFEAFPAPPRPLGPFAAVSAGHNNDCGLHPDGTIACWGGTATGLGPPPGGVFAQVATGNGYACARTPDGDITCWGWRHNAALTTPAGPFVDLAVGGHAGCARRADGTVACWGDTRESLGSPPEGRRFEQISVGQGVACGVDSTGAALCWGPESGPLASPPAGPHEAVEIGGRFACALRRDHTVACWGKGEPWMLDAPTGEFKQISVSQSHACGVRASGVVWCWGSDAHGESESPEPHLRADPALAWRSGYGLAPIDKRWPSERLTMATGGPGTIELTNTRGTHGELVFHDTFETVTYGRPVQVVYDAQHEEKPGFPLLALTTSGSTVPVGTWDALTLAVTDGQLHWSANGGAPVDTPVTAPVAWTLSAARIATSMPQLVGATQPIAWFDARPPRSNEKPGVSAGKIVCTGRVLATDTPAGVPSWEYTVFGSNGMSSLRYRVTDDRHLIEIWAGGGVPRLVRAAPSGSDR